MDYQKVYRQIVERAKAQNRSKKGNAYYESHHIVPKCMGGSNESTNKVLLTAREHYICHALLFRANPESRQLAHAFYLMCNFRKTQKRDYQISSRLYEDARAKYAGYRKIKQREDIKKYWTEERKQQRSKDYSGTGNPNYGKIGSFSGDKNPMKRPEVKQKHSIRMKSEKNPSKTHRRSCEFCNLEVSFTNYIRWHGKKCKIKEN